MTRRFLFSILLIAVFAGCNDVDLYSGLKERDANEMVAILKSHGIVCTKKQGEEKTWGVTVPSDHFSDAVDLLKNSGYPKDDYVGVGEVFKKSGIVSSPSEERIRFMHALSQDLSETLSRIDGVLEARVHIVLPNNSPLGEQLRPSSAAVFIKYQYGVDWEAQIPEIKNLVVDSIEGLTYDKVTTAVFCARKPISTQTMQRQPAWTEVLSLKLASESVARFWTLITGLLGFAACMSVAAGISLVRPICKRWRSLTKVG